MGRNSVECEDVITHFPRGVKGNRQKSLDHAYFYSNNNRHYLTWHTSLLVLLICVRKWQSFRLYARTAFFLLAGSEWILLITKTVCGVCKYKRKQKFNGWKKVCHYKEVLLGGGWIVMYHFRVRIFLCVWFFFSTHVLKCFLIEPFSLSREKGCVTLMLLGWLPNRWWIS